MMQIWAVTLSEDGPDKVSLSDQWFFVSEKSAREFEADTREHYGEGVDIFVEKKEVTV
jgi:hypothetical protein